MSHKLKTNLHFHTSEDFVDAVEYNLKEGIDRAAASKFDVLAVTCHNRFSWTEEHADYAKDKGILLVPGIETDVDETPNKNLGKGKHLIILNADKDAEKVRTFKDWEDYRKARPDAFFIAPHPYFYGSFSLGDHLEEHIHLIDAIEHSWFYSKKYFNRNKKAIEIAKKHNKPIIATSDTHFFDDNHLDRNYAVVHAKEKTIQSVFDAIKNENFENVTEPSSFFKHMLWNQAKFVLKKVAKKTEFQQNRKRTERTEIN